MKKEVKKICKNFKFTKDGDDPPPGKTPETVNHPLISEIQEVTIYLYAVLHG